MMMHSTSLLLWSLVFIEIAMTTTMTAAYSIGTPGKAWGVAEKAQWLQTRTTHRNYNEEVISKLEFEGFTTHQYGSLTVGEGDNDKKEFPLFVVQSNDWDDKKPCVLITGGVHGYEKSGVQGAIQFLRVKGLEYSKFFNILVAPCVSPWGYEKIERWNARAVDPNRSFNPDGTVVEGRSFNPEPATEESTALIGFLKGELGSVKEWTCHIDLHETTDSDASEYRPAKQARDGVVVEDGASEDPIPDGFYLVSDSTNPQTAWHKAMIDAVRKVTHIAPADPDGTLIGEPVVQEGVIAIPDPKTLGLCAGVTNAAYAVTTEVYPDSPQATEEQCNDAQVACIEGGLQHIMQQMNLDACSSTQ